MRNGSQAKIFAQMHISFSRTAIAHFAKKKWATVLLVSLDWSELRREISKLRLAQRREDGRPWSLEDLAGRSGVDKSTIHRIENTKKYPKHVPDLETLEAVMSAFGLHLSDLLAQLEKKSGAVTSPDSAMRDKRTTHISGEIHGPATVPSAADLAEAIALFKQATAIVQSGTAGPTIESDRTHSGAHPPKPHSRKRRA